MKTTLHAPASRALPGPLIFKRNYQKKPLNIVIIVLVMILLIWLIGFSRLQSAE